MNGFWRHTFGLLSPGGPRARLPILIFHRVVAQRDELFPGEVTADEFDHICGWLNAWFEVRPLADAVQALRTGQLGARCLCVTFDDGYADNHDVALPILIRHGLVATFFVSTGFLDGGRMWNDSVIEAVRHCPSDCLDLRGSVAESLGTLPLQSAADRRGAVDRIIRATKYLQPSVRREWVSAIESASGAQLPNDLMMTSGQVRALKSAGMEIGAHTVTHPILLRLPLDEAAQEIDDGRKALESICGVPIRLFAYPNGRPNEDYGEEAVRLVKDMGFDAAVSTSWGVARYGVDVFQLPRFTPWDRSRSRFAARMARNMLAPDGV